MHRKLKLDDLATYKKIKELSNVSKFRIIELTQKEEKSITDLKKEINLAFNKCSNYCSQLEKMNLIAKRKDGKSTFVKSKIILSKSLVVS